MNYLLVFTDGNVTSRNTITNEDREEVELGQLDIFQFSCNFMHFTHLVVESYIEDNEAGEDEDDDIDEVVCWSDDKWEVVK